MKRNSFGKGVLATLFVTMLVWTVIGCSESSPTQEEPVLQSIVVTSLPYKTEYAKGEALDLTGLVVTGTYSDNTTKTETVSVSNVSGYNAYTTGTQTLTVTISGKTATFTVSVSESPGPGATLQSIAVTSPPAKTEYAKDEALDLTGLVVTGTYSDNTTKAETVELSNVTGYDANRVGEQTLTVMVNGKTAIFTVTVNNAALVSIAITSLPYKTAYTKGEALDLTGLVVTGTYADGTTKTETVRQFNISGYNADRVGQQTLTVTINGKTATFTVSVSESPGPGATLQSIAVTSPPAKTEYAKGEALDLTGLVVTGTYSDNTTKAETVSASNVSGYNAGTAGTQTLTVTISGKTATFTVIVEAVASITMNLEDPINGIPENMVLSKSGSSSAPASIALAIAGTYADYAWYLNDRVTPVSTTAGYTLNAADCPLGANFLSVEVKTADEAFYAKEITFTVSK
ncbi:MAG: bacterial Ig-like domain-containing protein [Treponema sp.]|jgi:hypothetical protein|nr:bacterial Ig-like domain-containing protein [Treponema sp.]